MDGVICKIEKMRKVVDYLPITIELDSLLTLNFHITMCKTVKDK